MDLVEFLRDRLDEEERIAGAAPRGPWVMNDAGSIIGVDGSRVITSVGGALDGRVTRWPEGPAAAHLLAHDPARVLRDAEAKRTLVELHAKDKEFDGCTICDNGNNSCGCMSGWYWTYPCDTLKILALPYSDHPEFREEWRP